MASAAVAAPPPEMSAAAASSSASLTSAAALAGQASGAMPAVAGPERPTDAFDRTDFDATQYINEMFPTEASLVGLDPLIKNLKLKIRRVDMEILSAVRHQSSSGNRARQDLGKAKGAISDLFGKINEIRRKAEQSELMVQEICRDIRKLDHAKKHLTHTITAFRRLSMLVNAVDQLQRAVEMNDYAEAAHLLEAVQQLSAHFQSFVQIPKVAELGGRLSTLQKALGANVMREFELLGTSEDKPNPLLLERLRSCCLVVDALGYKARDDLVSYICKKEMGVYTQIFSNMGETAQLERTERRYAWLRKRLRAREEVWKIFPEAWRVPQLLCLAFCSITKAQLAEILDFKAAELPGNVEALLLAVKATNDFEGEMAQRFGGAGGGAAPSGDEDEESGDGRESGRGSPASQVRQRYERMFRDRRAGADEEEEEAASAALLTAANGGNAAVSAAARTAFPGSISSVFSKHLAYYVEAEGKQLMETLDSLVREETWRPLEDESGTNILRCSSELFGVIKKSLNRCSRFVSRGAAMLQLAGQFQKVLRAFAGKLIARLPKTSGGGTTGTATAYSSDWHIRISDEDFGVVCVIITSAEYCLEVVGALGRNVAKLLEPPLGEQVDMGEEEEAFAAVTTACLNVLVLGVETKLDAPLTAMQKMNWSAVESVGDQSDFVNAFSRTLADLGPRLGRSLAENHFRYVCDKLAASFCSRFHEAVFRCRKISEAGSQQLLLDTQAIRGRLLELPTAGRPGEPAPGSFTAQVQREMGRAEALLKVVGSRPDTLPENFATLIPNGSASDFQRIVELKVLRKADAAALIDAFNRRVSRGAALQSSSALAAPRPTATAAQTATATAGKHALPTGILPRQSPPPGSVAGTPPARTPSMGSTSVAAAATAARVAASTQEFAARFQLNPNTAAAARAAAGTATERMREGMASSFASMKRLGFGMRRQQQQQGQGQGQGQ